MQLKDYHLLMGAKAKNSLKDNTKKEKLALDFLQAACSAYKIRCQNFFNKNVTCKSPFKSSFCVRPFVGRPSVLDLLLGGHTLTLDELLKLPELVRNVLIDEEYYELDMHVRKYIISSNLLPYDTKICGTDKWWGEHRCQKWVP